MERRRRIPIQTIAAVLILLLMLALPATDGPHADEPVELFQAVDPKAEPDGPGGSSSTGQPWVAPSAPPEINVWYGTTQQFGHLGIPQQWVNVLGNLTNPSSVDTLTYKLNGASEVELTIGGDGYRLVSRGDFNADIPYSDLNPGLNTVEIKAKDNGGNVLASETVQLDVRKNKVWPLPYSIDWNAAGSIQEVAQVVDGRWAVEGGQLCTQIPGYDRLVGIGDVQWDSYEVTVPITVRSIMAVEPARMVGLIMLWEGHTDDPPRVAGRQPKTGYYPFGAIGWYRWGKNDSILQITGNYAENSSRDTNAELKPGVRYKFKMRVENQRGQGAHYWLKYWRANEQEPSGWDLQLQEGTEDPSKGSFLLLAHYVDACFGDVTVTPLGEQCYSLTTTSVPTGGGSIDVDSEPNCSGGRFGAGTTLTLTATPGDGYRFQSWGGTVSGTANPITLTVEGDVQAIARFQQSPAGVWDVYLPLAFRQLPPTTQLQAPILRAIENADGEGAYRVSWTAVPGATSYLLQEAADSSFANAVSLDQDNALIYHALAKPPGFHYYRVMARDSTGGESIWSNVRWASVQ